MKPTLRHIALALPTGNTNHDSPASPPPEFRIFAAGVNPSEKGDFTFDEQAAKTVMDHAAKWANRHPLDWCHKMVRMDGPDPAEDGKASGWFTPELRDGELWATAITWTPLAREKIANREFVYFSPAFTVDEDERVVELTNVALTNIPAMHGLPQLVAADRVECATTPYADAPFVDRAWDAAGAIARGKKWAGIDGDIADATPAQRKNFAQLFAGVRGDGSKQSDYLLPHHDIVDGKLVTIPAGVSAALARVDQVDGVSDAERKAMRAHLEKHRDAWKAQQNKRATSNQPHPAQRARSTHHKVMTMTKDELKDAIHAAHAKIHGEMYDEAMKSAMDEKLEAMKVDELKAHHAKLAKMVPHDAADSDGDEPPHKEPDGDDAEKKADTKKADDATAVEEKAHSRDPLVSRVVELERELATLRSKSETSERATILDAAQRDGKVTPAEAKGEGRRGKFLRALSIDQLREYVETAPKLVSTDDVNQPAGAASSAPAGNVRTFSIVPAPGLPPIAVTLSADDVDIAERMGLGLEAFAKTRAKELHRASTGASRFQD